MKDIGKSEMQEEKGDVKRKFPILRQAAKVEISSIQNTLHPKWVRAGIVGNILGRPVYQVQAPSVALFSNDRNSTVDHLH